jgi:Asp-tRNA(Asn)/Glu-tRNA(Gln) amidotransferase A subunit family amidase
MNTSKLNELPAWRAAELLASRELTAAALMRACLDHAGDRDSAVQAFAHLDPDAALALAQQLDSGPIRGMLHGLPLGVKDLFDTADMPTTYGSRVYEGHRPRADAASVALCREAGALVMGKTVTTEFAYFQPGPTRNPRNLAHTPGGSSSGSAAAVADHMLPLALGTQTAGSIIRPASYCGVVGFKPTIGRVSRAGVKSLSESLDAVGGFGRCVRDVSLLAAVLTGDGRLRTPGPVDAPRIGLCRTPDWAQVDLDGRQAFDQATAAVIPSAAAVTNVDLPSDVPDLVALQKAVMFFEMSRALSHERLCHRSSLSDQLQQLLDDGMAITGEAHRANVATAALAQRSVDALFDRFDVLMSPSATGEAPFGTDATGDPVFGRGWTLLGLPCIHLPVTQGAHGLPTGIQLVGRFGDDSRLLAVAEWVQGRLLAKR